MIYKIGDKVVIKKWKQLKKEFEYNDTFGFIKCGKNTFVLEMRELLKGTDRILTITEITQYGYRVKENHFLFTDEMIHGLYFEKNEVIEVSDDSNIWFKVLLSGYNFKSDGFKIGDKVTWLSHGGESFVRKTGEIIDIVLPGFVPLELAIDNYKDYKIKFDGVTVSDKKRYLVEVIDNGKKLLYMPTVSKLRLA